MRSTLAVQCVLGCVELLSPSAPHEGSNAPNRPWYHNTSIMAILKKYWECVLQYFPEGTENMAAKKLQARLNTLLQRRTGPDGQS